MEYSNGLRIRYIPCKESELMSLHVVFGVGQDSEEPHEFEFCHLLEHLQAQLTSPKHPSAPQNIAKLEGLGVSSNAYCASNQTCYHSTFLAAHAGAVLDLYTNMLLHFQPDTSVLEQEVTSVLRELQENFVNDIYYDADNEINQLVFKGHRRAFSELDSIENVKDFHTSKRKQASLMKFRAKHYSPHNCCIVVAGPPGAKPKVMGYLEALQAWKNDSGGSHKSPWAGYKPPKPMSRHIRNPKLQVDTARVEFHWLLHATYKGNGGLRSKCAILYRLLAGGLGGRLIKRLRSDLGLVYAVHVSYQLDKVDPGLSRVGIELTCAYDKVRVVVRELLTSIRKPVTSAEWARLENLISTSYEGSVIPKHPELVAENATTSFMWENKVDTIRDRYKRQLEMVRRKEPMIDLGDPTYIFVVSNHDTLELPTI